MVAPKISEMSQKWRKMHWEFLKYIETVLKCTENFFNALECPEKHKIFPKFIWKFFKDTKYSCNESRIMENGLWDSETQWKSFKMNGEFFWCSENHQKSTQYF